MICPCCQGAGWLLDLDDVGEAVPCPECEGMGLAYCCEGAPIESEPDDAP